MYNDESEHRVGRERVWIVFLLCATVLLLAVTGSWATYAINRDNNADPLTVCLQNNSPTECAAVFDTVNWSR